MKTQSPILTSVPTWALPTMERIKNGTATDVDLLWVHPEKVLRVRGLEPDLWQINIAREIRTANNILLLCCRQSGKSESDAALALLTVLLRPPALILFLSKAARQAQELLRYKFMPMYEPWRKLAPMVKDNDDEKIFANGSRIVVLPDSEGTVRSYSSVSLIVLDEASRVSDSLFRAVRPMLSISKGRIIGSSTAFGQRGWFYENWKDLRRNWKRFNVIGTNCKRHTKRFLAEERMLHGDRWFAQEYENNFSEAIGSVFSEADITSAFGRVSEAEAWNDLFCADLPEPNVVDAKPLEW
jgi:hypothetical protein